MNTCSPSTAFLPDDLELSPGEIHFLWWFIQGSIMSPETRKRLRKAWGMCERHAWGWMAVESAFRSGYMHGPAILYEDVMGLALEALEMYGPLQHGRLRRRLRQKAPCLMCEEGYGPNSWGFVKENIVQQGRDLTELRVLAKRTSGYWREAVCGRCSGDNNPMRCRKHLIEDGRVGSSGNSSAPRTLVAYIVEHLGKYARSFQLELRGTQTVEDEASLISAVGWSSGWSLFLSLVDTTAP